MYGKLGVIHGEPYLSVGLLLIGNALVYGCVLCPTI